MRRSVILSIGVCCVFAVSGFGYGQQLSGRDIALKVHDSNKSAAGIVLKGQMILKNLKSGSSESRSVVALSVRNGGLSKSLFRFTDSSYSGTTFLTLERSGSDNLQYLYLRSVGSPRQIEGSNREDSFVDTDLSNEDLGGSRVDDYNYKRLPDQNIGGKECYVLERYPKSTSSNYSKHIVIIDRATMLPLSVKSYGRSGRVVKTMRSGQFQKVGGAIYVPMYMKVVDIEKKHETLLRVKNAVEKQINRGYFNRNRMNMRWAEQ